jgi:hypothetical protein
MSKQEKDEEMPENSTIYVYIPDEEAYGTVIRQGAYSSLIEFYDGGVGYTIELPNDEFNIIDEIGVGYIDETGEYL